MKLVDTILSHEVSDAFNRVLKPIMQLSLVLKPDNINEIASKVLADATALELIAKPGDRYTIPSQLFDPDHPESKARLYGVEEAELLYDEVYRFYSERNATHNPATTREIGSYLKKHRVYKSHFGRCDEAAIGMRFLSVAKRRGELIPRIGVGDILAKVDPQYSLQSQCLFPNGRVNREHLGSSSLTGDIRIH